jgi:hypothetical protein
MSKLGFNICLQLWLIFLLLFFFLQYSAVLSIFLGALAGLAGGMIATFAKSKQQSPVAKGSQAQEDESSPKRRRSGWWKSKQEKEEKKGSRRKGWRSRRTLRSHR